LLGWTLLEVDDMGYLKEAISIQGNLSAGGRAEKTLIWYSGHV
jgi:hypothetical protein